MPSLALCETQLLRAYANRDQDSTTSTKPHTKLVVIDAPPGFGKSTIEIPKFLMRLCYLGTDLPRPFAALYRERKDNLVESEEWLNMIRPEEVLSNEELARG
jgi:hypothetical protein